MSTLAQKVDVFILTALLNLCLVLNGCSQETLLAEDFHVPGGSSISFQTDVRVTYAHSGLYFTLSGIPATKNDRDFSDILSIELRDDNGMVFKPEKIRDINGQRRDVVAFCNNIPKGTRIKLIKIKAPRNLQGSKIRWWSGQLK